MKKVLLKTGINRLFKNVYKMKRTVWKKLEDVKMEDFNSIHVDTRDFYCLCKEEDYKEQLNSKEEKDKLKKVHNVTILISDAELSEFLYHLREITGGPDCEWRCVSFKLPYCEGWLLKYIRCYRKPEGWVICNGDNTPIDINLLTEDKLEKEYLNAH